MTKSRFSGKIKAALLCSVGIVAIAVGAEISRKKLINLNRGPSIQQYLNRLIEFSDTDSLDMYEDQFLTMVDFGSTLNEAFDAVVSQTQESDSL